MSEQDTRTEPRLILDARAPMRDGVELSADVYLPGAGDGPWPAILSRTPYDNTRPAAIQNAAKMTRWGYAVVLQDVRGRGDSDGLWEPFVNEAKDGHDTVEWVAAQSWCNGKVGMRGGSYGGLVQWLAARERPPHLTALVSTAAAGRWMEELPFRFGTTTAYWMWWLNLTSGRTLQSPIARDATSPNIPDWSRLYNHRPLRDVDKELGRSNTVWRTWLEHSTFDDYWRQLSLLGHFESIDIPVLHITGWFDGDQWGELFYWEGMKQSPAASQQWLISGPWDHAGTGAPVAELGGLTFGSEAVPDLDSIHQRFFDRFLLGIENGAEGDPKVKVFTMGRNQWQDAEAWPLPSQQTTPLYFHSDGHANSWRGDGTLSWERPTGNEPPDGYHYDPDDPTPAVPHPHSYPPQSNNFDRAWKLERQDLLVYTSDPLDDDLELTGHPIFVLYASSDCPDTDWHVSLHDVWPDGRSIELGTGPLRAAYRGGLESKPTALEPGKVYEFRVEMMALSNLWMRGHRIRISVASANFPLSARNPNTNAAAGDDENCRVAHNRVYHTSEYPSHLLAPVIRPG